MYKILFFVLLVSVVVKADLNDSNAENFSSLYETTRLVDVKVRSNIVNLLNSVKKMVQSEGTDSASDKSDVFKLLNGVKDIVELGKRDCASNLEDAEVVNIEADRESDGNVSSLLKVIVEIVESEKNGSAELLEKIAEIVINSQSFSDFHFTDINGDDVSFEKYKGKCVLVVNTASSSFYSDANMRYFKRLGENSPDLNIVAIPSNDFKNENSLNEGLKSWFKNYEFKGDIMQKTDDLKETEVYKFLIEKADKTNLILNDYHKFLVLIDGKTVKHYDSKVKNPDSVFGERKDLVEDINECLKSYKEEQVGTQVSQEPKEIENNLS